MKKQKTKLLMIMPKKTKRTYSQQGKIGSSKHKQWNQTYQRKQARRVLEHEPEKARAILSLKDKPVPLTEISKRFGVMESVIREIFRQNGGRSQSVLNQIRSQANKGKKRKAHDTAGKETKTKLGTAYKKRLIEYRRMAAQRLLETLQGIEGEIRVLRKEMKTARFNHQREEYYSYRDKVNRRQIRVNAIKAILREKGLLE